MAPSLWSKETVAVVTGSNRGIGYEIVRMLAEQGLTVVLTARDEKKGNAAADALVATGFKNVDAANLKSVQDLTAWLKSTFGGIDILINNAGIGSPTFDYEYAKRTMETDYYGVKNVTSSLLPLMKASSHGARIVNVTSRMGLYDRIPSEDIKKTFQDEDGYTVEVADSPVAKYLDAMKAGRAESDGWLPNVKGKEAIYSESKMFLNVYAGALAISTAKSQPEGHQIFVASMCPGVTRTDMMIEAEKNGFVAHEGYPIKAPAEGADTAVWLALLPVGEWQGKNGKLFGERTEYLFGWKIPGW